MFVITDIFGKSCSILMANRASFYILCGMAIAQNPEVVFQSCWKHFITGSHYTQAVMLPVKDILTVIEKTKPETIVPIHTEKPELLRELCSCQNVMIVKDGEKNFSLVIIRKTFV